jgi:hypothetical protein
VRTLSFLPHPKRLSLLRDFKRQLTTIASTDNSLREYTKASLKNLQEFSSYHKYDLGTFDATAQEDLEKKGSPFKDMTDQISDNFMRRMAKKPLRPSSEGFKSIDKGSNFLEVSDQSCMRDVEEFIVGRQNFKLNLNGDKGNYMKSRISGEALDGNGGVGVLEEIRDKLRAARTDIAGSRNFGKGKMAELVDGVLSFSRRIHNKHALWDGVPGEKRLKI